MSTASSTAFLLWAILSVLFLVFLVHHLWCYDKFKCLRWSAGRQPGAFKRVMTYSYLGAVPLFAVFSIGTAIIKYREGFVPAPDGTFIPRPIQMYREENREWVLPLQFVFSIAWALELVTHLEELAFWLYLLHQNPNKEAWFSSWEYRLWYMGSLVAIIGMPLTTLITREHLETCDAYIFLVGSAGSTSTTISFLYVLWRFPKFIRHVKAEGADPSVVVRLATFYQLNQVRVVFRFLFTLPLMVIALDGLIGVTHPVNRNLFLTDFFTMIAGIGCFVSSMITLLIFFPRSIVREAGYKPKLASTAPTSPKSPPVTPPSRSGPFSHRAAPRPNLHQLPMHIVSGGGGGHGGRIGIVAPAATTETGATGMSVSMATWELDESAYTYTASVYSPRESLYDSPQYTAEDYVVAGAGVGVGAGEQGAQRRGSRVSRRGSSRRVSAHNAMDVHEELESDADDELSRDYHHHHHHHGAKDLDLDADADEESVPPYSHAHPDQPAHPHPHPHLYQRHPFPHSASSPLVVTAAQLPPGTGTGPGLGPDAEARPPVSPPAVTPPVPATHPRASAKRRTWGWDEARVVGPGAHGHPPQGLHVIASGPGPTAVGVTPAGGVGLGVNMNMNLSLSTAMAGGRRVSSLHPYVVNFTSPIDLVDIPPMDDLPRAI
ncbi:hypothetical protein C8Q79DRAFT_1011192 [Trametes meyenii]|nr:hypothetical protein C8Q79DRAFT_1011192 [Trametes meyenii]